MYDKYNISKEIYIKLFSNDHYFPENIYEYSSSEMNQYIATHTEEIYDNINDQRYMILYYLYQDDLLDEKDNELLVNNGTRFRQVLDVSNSAEELRENLL